MKPQSIMSTYLQMLIQAVLSLVIFLDAFYKATYISALKRPSPSDDVDKMISNGFSINYNATANTLPDHEKKKFALQSSDCAFIGRDLFGSGGQTIVKGGAGWTTDRQQSEVMSSSAVWTMGMLLSPDECDSWIHRGENLMIFDDSDFIFKTGKNGYERMPTGGRRNSATMVIEDKEFSIILSNRIKNYVPHKLNDGRVFMGVRETFLLSRYNEGQYFAPHFDGSMTYTNSETSITSQSAFTAVLYLSDDFEGGATHYLPGLGSEVDKHIAVQPKKGFAVIHRVVTVLHSGGQVISGTKYVMQFGVMYEAEKEPDLKPLRWGA